MNSPSNIVITGLGLATSLGLSPQQTWSAIVAGRSGIGPMSALEQQPTCDKGGGQALDLPENFHGHLPRVARYLRFVIEQALHDSLGHRRPSPPRVGVVLGTTLHGMRAAGDFLRGGDARKLCSFLAGNILQSAVEGLEFTGPLLTTCSACSSGLGAIALGNTLLQSGLVDLALCGGYDPVSEYAYAGFDSLRLIAEGLPRPFANDRDGMKVAEGYGMLVLERADDAANRGADILAFLAGIGETSDAFHLTQPHPEGVGAAAAARSALTAAGLSPRDVDMISAHATATQNNDAAEYAALAAVFGSGLSNIPVVAFKSYLGHTLGGAGAVELVLSVLARRASCVPSTANTREVDPQWPDLNAVRPGLVFGKIQNTINFSLGFGGANACAVLSDCGVARDEFDDSDGNEPVITGVGVVLPGAIGANALSLLATKPKDRPESEIAVGPINENQYAHLLHARRTRRMSEYSKLTLAAATAACRDAGVAEDSGFLSKCSVILGTTHGASPFCEAYYSQIVKDGLASANPVLFAEGVPNAAAAHLSMALGINGGCQTLIGTRCAGVDALALASLRIRLGLWPSAIVGVAEEFSNVVADAYRVHDLFGDGQPLATGSGAVSFVLESRSSAASRGAAIYSGLGNPTWQSAHGVRCACDVVYQLKHPTNLICAYGNSRTDLAIMHGLRRQMPHLKLYSIADRLPELFSVGPLAALAAAIIGPAKFDFAACGVLASEFTGPSCGLLLNPAQRITSPA